ncbi:MAG: InlB B-repeat-containing protein, partial [Clostridia bacterium]|nr:InlB B-repeat-containing protein [Clostridia bacterium]
VTVSFIANGGTAVPSQIIAEGDTATSGQTTREGYTFRGWSTDKDNYTAFDFGTHINEDLTLYAFWDAKLVPVTIVYMYEHADDAEYSPAGKSTRIYAPAGSYISIEKSEITQKNQTHTVRYADTMEGALTGYAKQTEGANSANATIPDISDTYYQYDHATNKRWVNPDGSTTVLVYYNRARVTLTFAYDESRTKASIDYTGLISEANRTKYAVSYTQDSTSKFTYSFTAKYGEDITAVWPQVGWVKDSDGNTPSYSRVRDAYTFYAWQPPTGSPQSSNMYTLEANLFNNNSGLSIVEGKLVGTGSLPDVFTSVKKDWLIYARTTLPGESVDFTYNYKNYTIYKEACQLGYTNTGTFGYKSLNGCTPISGTPTLYDDYGSNMSISSLSVNTGSSLKAKFDETFPNQIASGDNCQVLLYDRSTLKLNVWTNDDTHSASDPQTSSYLYGDKIYNEDTDLLKSLETTMTKAGYVFAGWYTTSEFTPGTEYKPDENSAITANMNLYAKWEPNQFRAEYYLYRDDADPYAWQGFAEGGKIDDKLVPSAVQDSFLGWYWYQNGQLVPFDFTSAVGANHVDANGVLKLYAKWSGTNGKVSYLPGIGGENATQEVVDEREFAINEASVQLPQYTGVWGSGVPNDPALTFVGWKAPNGAIYQPGRYVLVTRNLMQFEAQWSKDAVKLIYNANGGNGDDVTENWARNSVVSIWDNMDGTTPHFTREYYTLLGWDENPDATTPTYQLGQGSITLDKDVTTLYAIWKLNTVELTIQKTVSGNMYNANDEFSFTLAYDGKSETFTLKGGESKTFQVPVGAEVTVTEDLTKSNGYIPSNGTGTTVTLTAASEKDGIFKFTMPEEDGKLVINNDKTVQIDTGISLETVPYILILAVVVIGAVLLIKRRRNRDDD